MADIRSAAAQMAWLCDDGNVGYDQSQRWTMDANSGGGETDCSAMIIAVLRWAGFDTGSASYTGNMAQELCAHGWEQLPADLDSLRVGDILLNHQHHVVMVVDGAGRGATIAQASIDENGRASGGRAGDQTDWETNTRQVYNYWAGWDCILRYTADGNDAVDTGIICGQPAPLYRSWVRDIQREVGSLLGGMGLGGCAVDGIPGIETQRACVRLLQDGLNSRLAGLETDGWAGEKTYNALKYDPIGMGYSGAGYDVYAAKCGLVIQGWDIDLRNDVWDETCDSACKQHQRCHGLEQDGIVGRNTLATLLPLACV